MERQPSSPGLRHHVPSPLGRAARGYLHCRSAAAAYEAHKRAYLNTAEDCVAQVIAFIPMVGEPSGGWGTSAICTFKALAKAQTAGTDLDCGSVLASELQHLSTAVRRANA